MSNSLLTRIQGPGCGCAVMLLLTISGLIGCTMADWSYHFGISQGIGTNEFDRPVTSFDSEVTTVGVGMSYSPGVGSRHDELIDATRRVEYATLYHHPLPHPVQDAESAVMAEDDHWPIAGPPEDVEEGRALAWYGVYLVLAGIALVLLTVAWRMGLPIPMLPKYKPRCEENTETQTED